ncbi:four-carbon acid sugar kinase family protein, partial [Paenibacillus sp. 598K]|uniref:four-carbon acid sugar kinase family protein n=1 Tax=Paenibacillus sp. 598K TaxID=1117987 RepID=UPI0021A9C6B6
MIDNLNSAAEQCSGGTGTANESVCVGAGGSAGTNAAMAAQEDRSRNVGSGQVWQYAYYGDDFTGSTDVLEALFRCGLRPVLFLDAPTEERLGDPRFAATDACGVAGVGRSLSPEEMARELPAVLETLRRLGPAIVHYKICSTFDSAPHVGSIGKAAELGAALFGGRYVPILAGVPYLGRYTVFGHHFAAAGESVYRLDRHPTMSRHPVTPMAESDLRLHLAQQTELSSSLMDILAL